MIRMLVRLGVMLVLASGILISGCGGDGGHGGVTVTTLLQGPAAGNMRSTVVLNVFPSGNGNLVSTTNLILDENGSTTAILPVHSGVYDVTIKESTHLSARIDGFVFDRSNPGTLHFGVNIASDSNPDHKYLLGGDLNNDDTVDQADLNFMESVWGTKNSTADINRDGIVDAADFAILESNMDKHGQ